MSLQGLGKRLTKRKPTKRNPDLSAGNFKKADAMGNSQACGKNKSNAAGLFF
jgi:hypothetical protein